MRQGHFAGNRRKTIARTGKIAFALAICAMTTLPGIAAAQAAWPSKPVRIVVPFPPGSFTDLVARVVSENLSKSIGQPVIVDNKSGANGVVGVGEVARSAADGYTLLVTNSSSITINPQLYKSISYKVSDFVPITSLVESPFILVVNPEWAQKNKVGSTKDLLEYAKKNPGQLTYGSAGPGNIAHLGFTMLSKKSNVQTMHVPYKGASMAQTAIISGEINAAFDTWAALPHIQSGKLKALAVSSNNRMQQLPDVPTVEQEGVPDFNLTFWIGLLAPAGTPPQIIRRIHQATSQGILENPKSKTVLSAQGEIVIVEPDVFSQRINREVSGWRSLIKSENLTLD
ncbi:Bug family tripartite tricarboxylate transporter substrate binding protein [Noviherbaspirillum aerium]|uniref:Bug family tripartite tricarboxylate transporter substrate binding protein n=1 Tax=Noviherbaspirillum aerium TaxID=2588497 RepID=UPI001CEF9A6F|nr:tripartite tricarboxylate transporter substrate binding protein [Noviherbaspirillum aerium]